MNTRGINRNQESGTMEDEQGDWEHPLSLASPLVQVTLAN
jgi:hypothetical protein